MSQRLFELLVAGALVWPWLLGGPQAISEQIEIHPGRSQVIYSTKRGLVEEVDFELVNSTGSTLDVTALHKSCDCIDLRIVRSRLIGGESTRVVASTRVPELGTVRGAFALSVDGVGDAARSGGVISLSFKIVAAQSEPLLALPSRMRLSSQGVAHSRAISLSTNLNQVPREVVGRCGDKKIDVEVLAPWSAGESGLFASVVRVDTSKLEPAVDSGPLSLVVLGDESHIKVDMPIDWISER